MKVEKEIKSIINFIKKTFISDDFKGVVIGVDGYIDSSVVAALFTKALGKENVLVVAIPNTSNKINREAIQKLVEKYELNLLDIDFINITGMLQNEICKQENFTEEELKNSSEIFNYKLKINTLRYLAALYSQIKSGKYVVAGTLNKCESFVNRFAKFEKSEMQILKNLSPKEIKKIAEYLEIPKEILEASLSIEERQKELGVLYRDIEQYIENEYELDIKTRNKIEKLNRDVKYDIRSYTYEKLEETSKRTYRYKTKSNASAFEWPTDYVTRYFTSEKAARLDALMENWNSPYELYIPIIDEDTGDYEYSKPIELPTGRNIRYSVRENDREHFEKITMGFDKEEIEKICINAIEYGKDFKVKKEQNRWIVEVNHYNKEKEIFESYGEIYDACVEAWNVYRELGKRKKELIR